jgi:hypothetical protein
MRASADVNPRLSNHQKFIKKGRMKEEVIERSTWPVPAFTRRISWGAIFAGLFVTIGVQLIFSLLGAAIGAATVDPLREQDPARGLGLMSAIWLLVSGLISLWVGACVAGRLSGGPRRADGLLHGIVTWSVSICATLFLLATAAGALLGGTGALLGGAMGIGAAKGGASSQSVEEQVKNLFPQAGALLPPTGRTAQGQQPPGTLTDLAAKDSQLGAALARMEKNGGANQATSERDEVISRLTSQHGMDQQQAANLVGQWDQQFQQLKGQTEQKAREAGDVAARGVSKGALWAFIALFLGFAIAAWGGWSGAASLPKYSETSAASV